MRWVALMSAALLAHTTSLVAQEKDSAAAAQQAAQASGPAAVEMTLDEAIQRALRSNPALLQAHSNVEVAEYNRLSAVGSFLPNLSMSYGYANSSTGRVDPTGQTFSTTSYSLQLGGSYDLFTGFRRFSDLKSARLNVRSSEASYRGMEYQTIFNVKQAYFAAIAARELVKVDEDRVKRQEDQLDFVRQQIQLGRATRADELSSLVDLNNAKLTLLQDQNTARLRTYELAEIVGMDRPVAPVAESTLELPAFPYSLDELLNMAAETGPNLVSAQTAADAAQANVSVAKSSYLPSLRFSGGWAWQAPQFPPQNRSWGLSLSGNYPLFNGFQRESAVFTARAQADAADAQKEAARLGMYKNVASAYDDLQAAQAGIALAQNSVDLSQEELRVATERYRLGLATILDLQSAQINLSQAQVNLIQQRFSYPVAIASLEALIGTDLVK